jgi:dipeptidyl aminopeptidase/acylaminoacyl peptidase
LVWFVSAALAQGTRADYDRMASLDRRSRDTVFHANVTPHWAPDGNSFWYTTDGPKGEHQAWVVDAVSGTRRAATEAERKGFASSSLPNLGQTHRSASGGGETTLTVVNHTDAPVTTFWISTGGGREKYHEVPAHGRLEEHTFVGHVWLVADANGGTLGVYEAVDGGGEAVIDPAKTDASPAATQPTGTTRPATRPAVSDNAGGRRRRRRPPTDGGSPDGKWVASIQNGNVFLRDRDTGRRVQLTSDATDDNTYDSDSISWSPDSAHLVVHKTLDGDHRLVYEVQSSPPDQEQPKLLQFEYLKPGDRIALTKPHLFDVAAGKEVKIDQQSLFATPWEGRDDHLRWDTDGKRFTFYYNQRGHQVARVIGVDAATGHATAIVDDEPKTFVDYSGKFFLQSLSDNELVWMSERDGWNHLFLIDAKTGAVKNTITRGDWVVRSVDRIDTDKRQVFFQAGGIDPKQDPYYVHFCRVNLDGTGLVDLTPGDGTHKVAYSPDGRFYVDTYSRVDLPPVNELRRSSDGKLICPLEHADAHELLATGWRYPERFVAKGRDGTTDIYGIIERPTNFDPGKKYPVIEDIYAGPQDSFVPKGFTRRTYGMGLAELGFIVVQIDGMGTSNRSKAFHDVCWHNLGDAGFPDRILWIKAAAKLHPEMDLTKGVGIYGTSAGGQDALRAVEAHGDFYTAAVADCGCHDNRMDKIWWNEQWMGWPVGPWYAEQSNVTNAKDLKGALLLIVGETDHNVDPASTMQVCNALIKADKDFDLLVIPNADHGQDGTYGDRRRKDFFVRHLLGVEPRAG